MGKSIQKAICILGMHRSGTSAITRAINLLGPTLGDGEKLMPPKEKNNPDGFWEHKDIYYFHERLLKALGRTWHSTSPMPKEWWTKATIGPYRKELTEIIRREFSGHPAWIWKDPRTSLLLPLWQEVLREMEVDAFYVLCLRNPLDIAESLKRRDGLSKRESLSLWLLYTASACHWTNEAERIVISYDDLLADSEKSLKSISRAFQLSWLQEPHDLKKDLSAFLKTDSRHSYSDLESLLNDISVPPAVIPLYQFLLECQKTPAFLQSNQFKEYVSALFSGFRPRTYRALPSSTPKVSVVIPSYNHEKYIPETIESVLNQTFQDFEVIITDDASTDKTVREIKIFEDPRIRLFCFSKNQGQFSAMRKCIEEARGEYIAVLNSDDLFLPRKLEKQGRFLDEHPEISAVFTYAAVIDDDGNELEDRTHYYYDIFKQPNRTRHEWLNYFFYKGNCLCHPSVLIRSRCHKTIGHYEERFGLLGDLDFWVRLCLKEEIHIIPETLTIYRIFKDDTNPSAGRLDTQVRFMYELSHILNHYLRIPSSDEFRKIFVPAAGSPDQLQDDLIPFHVAMAALNVNSPVHQLFGLNTLYQILRDGEMAKKVSARCDFSYPDFIQRTGKHDIFGTARMQGERPQKKDTKESTVPAEPSPLAFRPDSFSHTVPAFDPLHLNDINSLSFSLFDDPRVSIIIPVWNHWEYTYRCLQSIMENTDEVPYEVILVDNGSSDETPEMLRKVENLRLTRNDSNLGFLLACHQGAENARGTYLLFLNNDTMVTQGWLKAMVSLVDSDDKIGAVGAKLIYPDGTLQNAGGMVFSDGRGWDFGNGDDPEKKVYNQPCEMDYCLGACLLVREKVFRALGGFDVRYAPGYYEEIDLCFAMRKRGYKVLYNPKAVVIHFESVTAGKDLSSLRGLIEINRKQFITKWENELIYQDEHPSVTGQYPVIANRERLATTATFENKARNLNKLLGVLDTCTEEQNALREAYLESEADRAARLEVIERQAKEFSDKIAIAEADRAARLEVIQKQAREFSETIVELKSSMSWKITAPLRWILDQSRRISGRASSHIPPTQNTASDYVYQPEKRDGDIENNISLLQKHWEVVRGWVNHRDPQVVESIHRDLERTGIPVKEWNVSVEEYNGYFEKAAYKDLYPNYYKEFLPEKSFEHFVALRLLDIHSDEIFIDIASENSPTPEIYSRLTGCKSYRQDISYPSGMHGDQIGGDACEMAVPDQFAHKIALTCSLEHFEGERDRRLFLELGRVLRKGGKVCIVPFYVYTSPANQIDPAVSIPNDVPLDKNVTVFCAKNWGNRFGRFYSPASFLDRIFNPTKDLFIYEVFRIINPEEVNPAIYAHFALVATRI